MERAVLQGCVVRNCGEPNAYLAAKPPCRKTRLGPGQANYNKRTYQGPLKCALWKYLNHSSNRRNCLDHEDFPHAGAPDVHPLGQAGLLGSCGWNEIFVISSCFNAAWPTIHAKTIGFQHDVYVLLAIQPPEEIATSEKGGLPHW